jgi:hypothetical protein
MEASDDHEFLASYWKDPRAYQGHSLEKSSTMNAREYFQGFQDSGFLGFRLPKEAFSEQYLMQYPHRQQFVGVIFKNLMFFLLIPVDEDSTLKCCQECLNTSQNATLGSP